MKLTTFTPSQGKIQRNWIYVDAADKILGDVAVVIARHLTGKNKAEYTTNINVGDQVVVTNAQKIKVTGKKLTDKEYIRYTGYPGGIRKEALGKLLVRRPEEALRKAVSGMLPKNKLQRERMASLHIYAGTEHPHTAQKAQQKD